MTFSRGPLKKEAASHLFGNAGPRDTVMDSLAAGGFSQSCDTSKLL